MLKVCFFWIFQGLWLQDDDALRCCDFHGQEVGNVRDRRNDSVLLSGSSNGSFTIVRAPIHGKCLTLIRFIYVYMLGLIFPPLLNCSV